MASLLPNQLAREWAETQFKLAPEQQLRPFRYFYLYLKEKQPMLRYMADSKQKKAGSSHIGATASKSSSYSAKCFENRVSDGTKMCLIHESKNHILENCKRFISLAIKDKKTVLAQHKCCFRCFGNHLRTACVVNDKCKSCGRLTHHTLMCNPPPPHNTQTVNGASDSPPQSVQNNHSKTAKGTSLYAIYSTPVAESSQRILVAALASLTS